MDQSEIDKTIKYIYEYMLSTMDSVIYVKDLVKKINIPDSDIEKGIEFLVSENIIERWNQAENGKAIIFSSSESKRIGRELSICLSKWKVKKKAKRKRVESRDESNCIDMNCIADKKNIDPSILLERSEIKNIKIKEYIEHESIQHVDVNLLPKPTILYGSTVTWSSNLSSINVIDKKKSRGMNIKKKIITKCGSCPDVLKSNEYCLECDRWFYDIFKKSPKMSRTKKAIASYHADSRKNSK